MRKYGNVPRPFLRKRTQFEVIDKVNKALLGVKLSRVESVRVFVKQGYNVVIVHAGLHLGGSGVKWCGWTYVFKFNLYHQASGDA